MRDGCQDVILKRVLTERKDLFEEEVLISSYISIDSIFLLGLHS